MVGAWNSDETLSQMAYVINATQRGEPPKFMVVEKASPSDKKSRLDYLEVGSLLGRPIFITRNEVTNPAHLSHRSYFLFIRWA